MNRRTFMASTSGLTVTAVAGCLGDDEQELPPVDPEDVAATVDVQRFEFDPVRVSIDVGQAIEWRNVSGRVRTVTSNSQGNSTDWNFTARLEPDETARYLFEEAGVYGFHEQNRTFNTMCGAVGVGMAEEDVGQLPCELP